jgi:hypothetical protein
MVEEECTNQRLLRISTEASDALTRHLFAAATSEVFCSGRLPLLPVRHFAMIGTIDVSPFMEEVAAVGVQEFGKNSRHTIRVQRDTESIELMARATQGANPRHDQQVRPSRDAEKFPKLMSWLQEFAATTGRGTLQIARIVLLKGLSQVYPHVDRGLYYLIRDRYHVVLKSPAGSRMQCESQTSTWYAGQVWWFNNHVVHQAFNDSSEERIHVIFDVLPERNRDLARRFQELA